MARFVALKPVTLNRPILLATIWAKGKAFVEDRAPAERLTSKNRSMGE